MTDANGTAADVCMKSAFCQNKNIWSDIDV